MTQEDDRAKTSPARDPSRAREPADTNVDKELRRVLGAIREEPVPERLLDLARDLQRLLRQSKTED